MKNSIVKLLHCCLVALLFFSLVPIVFAQEATTSPELIKKIKKRLSGEIEDIQEGLEKEPRKKAFIGNIVEIRGHKLILDTEFGEREASISATTDIFYYQPGEGQKEIEASSLERQDFVILMGLLEDDLLSVRRAVKTLPPETVEGRKLIFGQVTAIDNRMVEFTTQAGPSKETATLEITKDTPIKIKGKTEVAVEDIQIGDLLYAIVFEKDEEVDKIRKVLIIPGKNNPLSSENLQEATEEAETTP